MSTTRYRTFERQDSPIGTGRVPLTYTHLQYALALVILAFLLITPITFAVALIRYLFFTPSDLSLSSTLPPTYGFERKTFLLNVVPVIVRYPSQGSNCVYHVYSYGGTVPGPSLYVRPGMTFDVKVINSLGPDIENTTKHNNEYRFANITSTHFHGLHVSPSDVSDNVFLSVRPTESVTLSINLRDDHPAGTYFIHPHQHGSTNLQTAFALVAPLIVRDTDMYWKSLVEQVFVINQGGLDSGHHSSDARRDFDENDGPKQSSTSRCNPESFILINNDVAPLRTVCSNYLRRWRIINAGTDGGLVLKWKNNDGRCSLRLIARDGVYLAKGLPIVVSDSDRLIVPPGGRIDFLVKNSGEYPTECQLESIKDERVQAFLGPKSALLEGALIQCINHEGDDFDEPFPDFLPALPKFMTDLSNEKVVSHHTIEWTEFSDTHRPLGVVAKYGINGQPYSKYSKFSVRMGEVQEWFIKNALGGDLGPAIESHPFHMHTNHFQILKFSGKNPTNHDFTIGEWRDTVYIPTPGNLTIRWLPQHFTGKTLIHCHTLSHADEGMTWAFDIL